MFVMVMSLVAIVLIVVFMAVGVMMFLAVRMIALVENIAWRHAPNLNCRWHCIEGSQPLVDSPLRLKSLPLFDLEGGG